jgi:DNA-binding response OmpR family regulator
MTEEDEFPIVLLTARRVDSPERHEFVSTWSRADAVLYKPFALERLVGEIEQQLKSRAAAD